MGIPSNKQPAGPERYVLQSVAAKERLLASLLENQIAETSSAVTTAQSNYNKARSAMLEVRETLDVLSAQHARILQSLEHKTQLLHPLRGYPRDLLVDIFSYCLEKDNRVAGSKPTEIILSQVCREWRNVFHTSSILWQQVDINFERNPDPLQKVTHWVTLSKDAPLNISLSKVPCSGDKLFDDVLDLLVRAASRWRTLSVTTASESMNASVLKKLVVPTPQLRTLHLHSTSCSSNAIPNEFLPHAPLLQNIKLHEVPWPQIPLRFPALQSLRLGSSASSSQSQDFLDHISRFPALRDIDIWIEWHVLQENPSPYSFQNVTTLAFGYKVSHHFANAEAPLAFPNLKTLKLDYLENTTELQLLYCFLRNLPHPERLNRLVLTRCDDGDGGSARIGELSRCFDRITGLQTLRLENCKFNKDFIELFTTPLENPPRWLCTNLEQFEFKDCHRISGDVILRLIDSRCSASREDAAPRPRVIASVEVRDCNQVHPWQQKQIIEHLKRYQV